LRTALGSGADTRPNDVLFRSLAWSTVVVAGATGVGER
jgi:hypothetical protein